MLILHSTAVFADTGQNKEINNIKNFFYKDSLGYNHRTYILKRLP